MARDLRVIGNSLNDYPDRCYYYDNTYIKNNEINKEAQPLGRFQKRDVVPFQWQRIQLGNGVFSNDYHFIGTIETTDHVEKIRPNMFVVDQTGMLFIVESPIISDDDNKSKVVGRRPTIKTTMRLRGIELK